MITVKFSVWFVQDIFSVNPLCLLFHTLKSEHEYLQNY